MLGEEAVDFLNALIHDTTVLIALFVGLVSAFLIYYKTRPVTSQGSPNEPEANKNTEDEEDEYLREVARCALRLANHLPRQENSFSAVSAKGFIPRVESYGATSEDGDSMLVNLPEDLEEEHELDSLDLTADDISVEQDVETDSNLSPQDMADIAEELNTSLASVESFDTELQNAEMPDLLSNKCLSQPKISGPDEAKEITEQLPAADDLADAAGIQEETGTSGTEAAILDDQAIQLAEDSVASALMEMAFEEFDYLTVQEESNVVDSVRDKVQSCSVESTLEVASQAAGSKHDTSILKEEDVCRRNVVQESESGTKISSQIETQSFQGFPVNEHRNVSSEITSERLHIRAEYLCVRALREALQIILAEDLIAAVEDYLRM